MSKRNGKIRIAGSDYAKILHGGAALSILAGTIVMGLVVAHIALGPVLGKFSQLNVRHQSLEGLQSELRARQEQLAEKMQLIGVKSEIFRELLTSNGSASRVRADANMLREEIESFGFTVAGQSEATEQPLTETLSAYTVQLNFIGDAKAAVSFLSGPVSSQVYIARAALNGDDGDGEKTPVRLVIDVRRIGARTINNEGADLERQEDE